MSRRMKRLLRKQATLRARRNKSINLKVFKERLEAISSRNTLR